MNIFTSINEAETLIQLFTQYEPSLAKDVEDIITILNRIRDKLAQAQN